MAGWVGLHPVSVGEQHCWDDGTPLKAHHATWQLAMHLCLRWPPGPGCLIVHCRGEQGYMRFIRRGPWRPKQGLYWEGIYSASYPVLN